jgi:hypothetical protein
MTEALTGRGRAPAPAPRSVHVPARRQQPVDEQQAAEHRLAQQVPGRLGTAPAGRRCTGGSCAPRAPTTSRPGKAATAVIRKASAVRRRSRWPARRRTARGSWRTPDRWQATLNTCLSCVAPLAAERPTCRCSAMTAAPVAPPVSSAATHMTGKIGKITARPARPKPPGPKAEAAAAIRAGRHSGRPAAPGTPASAQTGEQHADRRLAVALPAGPAAALPSACRPCWHAGTPARRSGAASSGLRPPPFMPCSSPSLSTGRQQGLRLLVGQRLHDLQRAAHLVGRGVAVSSVSEALPPARGSCPPRSP